MDEDDRESSTEASGRRVFLLYLLYVIIQSMYLIFVLGKLIPPDLSIPLPFIAYFVLLGSGLSGALLWSLLGTSSYLFLFYRGVYRGPLSHILNKISIYFLFASISFAVDLMLFPIMATEIETYSLTKMLVDTLFSLSSFIYFYKSISKEYTIKEKEGAVMITLLLIIDLFLRIYYPKIVAQHIVRS